MLRMIIPLSLAFLIGFSSFADAQDKRARRRALVEDLLRGLIDSQVPDQPDPRYAQPRQPQPRPGVSGKVPQPKPRPTVKPVVVAVTPTMLTARKSLAKWNTTCGQLIGEIRQQEIESPQLRPLLGDALKVQANIDRLCRKSEIHPNLGPLKKDFQVLDSDWRMLSYRLKASGAMSTKCSGLANSISALDQELCGLFRIEPQINRVEITRLATKMSSDYDHLLHDLYYVCRSQPNGRKVLAKGQELQTLIDQVCATVGNGSYESIVGGYKQVMKKWKGFHREIHPFEDERIRRSVSELEIDGNLLREQLWLPAELDREYLALLSSTVAADANHVFNSISLTKLMQCKSPGNALSSAREFQNACAKFGHSISSGASVEDLKWDFRLFQVQWAEMNQMFREFEVPKVNNRLEDIQYSMATLRKSFGKAPVMDYNQMRQLCANLGALFQRTSQDIRQCVVEPNYQVGFQQQICSAADQCSLSAAQLNQRIARNPNVVLKQQDLNNMFVQWKTLKPLINQCRDVDKRRLLQMRSQIEPLMVKLQVVYAD